jgi:hypothetical protein
MNSMCFNSYFETDSSVVNRMNESNSRFGKWMPFFHENGFICVVLTPLEPHYNRPLICN